MAESLAVDASLIKADANWQNGIEGERALPPEATGRQSKKIWPYSTLRPSVLAPMGWRLTSRSGGTFDRGPWRAGVLCLFHQLPHRRRQRDHPGCRSDDRDPAGRGPGRKPMIEVGWPASIFTLHAFWATAPTARLRRSAWLVYEQGIEPHLTAFNKSDAASSRSRARTAASSGRSPR